MEQLGKEIETTRGTIGNFENGNKKPSLDMLIKLADYFNVSIDYLVGRTNDPKLHQKRGLISISVLFTQSNSYSID